MKPFWGGVSAMWAVEALRETRSGWFAVDLVMLGCTVAYALKY